jgi:hypothetical protein
MPLLDGRRDAVRLLLERHQLRVPSHGDVPLPQVLAHDAFVVVLTEHQDVRERAQVLAHVVEWDTRLQPPVRPHVRAVAGATQLERSLRQPELRVDLERARVHGHGSRLQSRTAMTIDDHRANAAPAQLIRQHQPGRACPNDKDISQHAHLLDKLTPNAWASVEPSTA